MACSSVKDPIRVFKALNMVGHQYMRIGISSRLSIRGSVLILYVPLAHELLFLFQMLNIAVLFNMAVLIAVRAMLV